ncbi:hypothetical protein AAMO2058_000854700 [Amorphochlora amoebiformis]
MSHGRGGARVVWALFFTLLAHLIALKDINITPKRLGEMKDNTKRDGTRLRKVILKRTQKVSQKYPGGPSMPSGEVRIRGEQAPAVAREIKRQKRFKQKDSLRRRKEKILRRRNPKVRWNARARRDARRAKMKKVLGDLRPWRLDMGALTMWERANQVLRSPKLSLREDDYKGFRVVGAGGQGRWREVGEFEGGEEENHDDGIIEATWGAKSKHISVKAEILRKIDQDGKGVLILQGRSLLSEWLPDPIPSQEKVLRITYRLYGSVRNLTLTDNVVSTKTFHLGLTQAQKDKVSESSYIEHLVLMPRYHYEGIPEDIPEDFWKIPRSSSNNPERSSKTTEDSLDLSTNRKGYPGQTGEAMANKLIQKMGRLEIEKTVSKHGVEISEGFSDDVDDSIDDAPLGAPLEAAALTESQTHSDASETSEEEEDKGSGSQRSSDSEEEDEEELLSRRQRRNSWRRALLKGNISEAFDHTDWEKAKRTLFVGNIPARCKKQALQNYFSARFGPVDSVRIRSLIPAARNVSKRVAFFEKEVSSIHDVANAYVVFKGRESVQKAVSTPVEKLKFNGRQLRIDYADSTQKQYDHKKSLFVGGLHPSVNEDRLLKVFSTYGKVLSVRVIRSPDTRESRGFGYVTMTRTDEARKALKLDKVAEIEGRVIRVRRSSKKKAFKRSRMLSKSHQSHKESKSTIQGARFGRHLEKRLLKERAKRNAAIGRIKTKKARNFVKKIRRGKATWNSPKNPYIR